MDEELVSSDFIGHPGSSLFDATQTKVLGDKFAKVFSWYDNEWGFANRMIDLALLDGSEGVRRSRASPRFAYRHRTDDENVVAGEAPAGQPRGKNKCPCSTASSTIDDLKLENQRLFIRVDFNVPLDKSRNITNDERIRASLPTIKKAIASGARVILASHLGRPKGKKNPEFSLEPAAARLSELLGQDVTLPGRLHRRRRRRRSSPISAPARFACSKTCASTRKKRRTTRPSRASSRRSATCT